MLAPIVADHDGDLRHRQAPRMRLRARRGGAPASGVPRCRPGRARVAPPGAEGRRARPREPRRACQPRSWGERCRRRRRESSSSGPPHGVTTAGVPEASASATTMPKPSCSDGRTKSEARRSSSATDVTSPAASTPAGSGPVGARPTRRSVVSGRWDRTCGHAWSSRRTFLRGSSARPTNTTVGRRSSTGPGR